MSDFLTAEEDKKLTEFLEIVNEAFWTTGYRVSGSAYEHLKERLSRAKQILEELSV
jgi:hypothetical protein